MTPAYLTTLFAVAVLAFLLGWFVSMLTEPNPLEYLAEPVDPLDTRLLDHLGNTKVSLFYNEDVSAWGVLSGGDKLICSGLTVRSALARAVDVADIGV